MKFGLNLVIQPECENKLYLRKGICFLSFLLEEAVAEKHFNSVVFKSQ